MMSDRNVAIDVVGMTKTLNRNRVLNNVSARFDLGEVIALTGENGSGKTTLLRCLASELRPDVGRILYFGGSTFQPATKIHIGMLGHDSRLYPNLTARENLIFAARMCGVHDSAGRAERWLQSTGLGDCGRRLPAHLSRGMRQRLAMARAMIHDPQIVLLDEPFSGLDDTGETWLVRQIQELAAQNRLVMFSTHNQRMAQSVATRRLHVRDGKLWEVSDVGDAVSMADTGRVFAA